MAIASENITADMVEAIEFPHLANKYRVQGVPRTVINETTVVEGAVPEPIFVANVLKAVGLVTDEDIDAMMESLRAAHDNGHDHDHEH